MYFSPDSKKVVSVSADKTAKVWNVDGSLVGLVFEIYIVDNIINYNLKIAVLFAR